MKRYNFKNVIIIFAITIFCFGTCRNEEEGQSLIVHNNSSKDVVPSCAFFPLMDKTPAPTCIELGTKVKRATLDRVQIPANSSKKINGAATVLIERPQDTLYIYLYNRIDVDKMSCEEFKQKNPIQKRWAITKTDAEAMNWTLEYP
jgi:hypothetical protein